MAEWHHLRNRCPTLGPLPTTVVRQVNSGDNHSNVQPLAMVPRGPHAGVLSEDRRIVRQPQSPAGEQAVRGTPDTPHVLGETSRRLFKIEHYCAGQKGEHSPMRTHWGLTHKPPSA
jgi:hypothetical protein